MKYFKIIMSTLFILLILGSLIYKNILHPDDKTSIFAQISDMIFPLFMLFSFFLLFLKKREDKKGQTKPTDEDKELYQSVDQHNQKD